MIVGAAPPPPDAAQELRELFQSPAFQPVIVVLAGLLVVSQVIAVFSHWIASKAVADKGDATVRNGFKVWLYHVLAALLGGVCFVLLMSMVSPRDHLRVLMLGGGIMLLGILVVFLVPMKVYRIGFWRSLGMLLLSGLIQSAAMTALQLAALFAPFTGPHLAALHEALDQKLEERGLPIDRLRGKDTRDELDRMLDDALNPSGPRKTLAEREAAAKAIQRKLEQRQRALPPSDANANAKFQRQLERYKRLLKEVKAERDATRSAGAR